MFLTVSKLFASVNCTSLLYRKDNHALSSLSPSSAPSHSVQTRLTLPHLNILSLAILSYARVILLAYATFIFVSLKGCPCFPQQPRPECPTPLWTSPPHPSVVWAPSPSPSLRCCPLPFPRCPPRSLRPCTRCAPLPCAPAFASPTPFRPPRSPPPRQRPSGRLSQATPTPATPRHPS